MLDGCTNLDVTSFLRNILIGVGISFVIVGMIMACYAVSNELKTYRSPAKHSMMIVLAVFLFGSAMISTGVGLSAIEDNHDMVGGAALGTGFFDDVNLNLKAPPKAPPPM